MARDKKVYTKEDDPHTIALTKAAKRLGIPIEKLEKFQEIYVIELRRASIGRVTQELKPAARRMARRDYMATTKRFANDSSYAGRFMRRTLTKAFPRRKP